ncbi:MAG: hypothetical protein OXK17_00810 [Thaumarchaeota archaeon]|nr:hypothetical protein [Nitrososphaerota archaeon]
MNAKNAKTAQTTLLIAAVSVLVLGVGVAYAEPPDHLRDEALKGKQLWDMMEQLRAGQNQTESEQKELIEAEEQFNEIRTTLNAYGIATPQQMAEDPGYWEDYNDKDAGVTGAAGSGGSGCDCPQKLKFKSGYSYKWANWWTLHKWSNWEYATATNKDMSVTVDVGSGQNKDAITPLGKYKLVKSGSAEFTATSRIHNDDNKLVRQPEGGSVVLSGTGTLTKSYKILDPASTDDELIIRVQITDIQ